MTKAKAYILVFRREQIVAVLHGIGEKRAFRTFVEIEGSLLNTTGLSEISLRDRFVGWYIKGKVLFEKTDVVKNIFNPTPEIKHY